MLYFLAWLALGESIHSESNTLHSLQHSVIKYFAVHGSVNTVHVVIAMLLT